MPTRPGIIGECWNRRWWRWRNDDLYLFAFTDPTEQGPLDGGAHNSGAFPLFLLYLKIVAVLDDITFFVVQCACDEFRLRV
jgi:hypothetical protein